MNPIIKCCNKRMRCECDYSNICRAASLMSKSRIWILSLLLGVIILQIYFANGKIHHHNFIVESSSYTRLCSEKKILTVNGKFPGPTLKAYKGDQLIVNVINKSKYNITIHWHGARQIRNPWADGVEYITQCPIKSGNSYKYKIKLGEEEGTIWWHGHSSWTRATVHGAFIIYPKPPSIYPFPHPHSEFLLILGEWWKKDVMKIPENANKTGGEPLLSDAFTINGQPGYLYPCSQKGTFRMKVEQGKTYLLRVVNAVMDEDLFFAVANHSLTLVAKDGIYMKPFKSSYIMITPGQTMDLLLESNQPPSDLYAIAIRSYSSAIGAGFDNKTTAAILHYDNHENTNPPLHPSHFPTLPPYDATQASTNFTSQFHHFNKSNNNVPLQVDKHLLFTISVNLLNCSNNNTKKPCGGPFGKRFSSSFNNVSFVTPSKNDVLGAYYYGIDGVFERDFPVKPPNEFNYTGDVVPERYLTPSFGTKVMVLEYNESVELVLQGTNVLASDNHPIHIHGYSFYVVGSGFGNFDPEKDPLNYNFVDPPEETTVGVPKNGWVAIRFRADNPGVWLMHCHIERHQTWGMEMVFIVKDGNTSQSSILPPPPDLPTC